MKNDNIHSFFSLFWLQILNLPASLQNKNTRIGPFPWKRSVLQNPDRERTNQSTGICLRLGLPYNNIYIYLLKTELRILDFQHFHWLAGHWLSAHIPALPNMVNESINKESWIKIFSRKQRPLTKKNSSNSGIDE